jgi:hypothetical protein
MNKMKSISLVVSASIVMLLSSCGEKGDPGPVGPPGNANVHSYYYTVNYTNWNIYGTSGTPNHSLFYEKYIPEITQAIIDHGMVVAYIYDHTLGAWVALPYTYTFAGAQEYYKFYTTVGIAGIDITLSTLQTPIAQQILEVKIVAVAGAFRQQHPDIDWSNYEMVKERLNLD